MSTRRVQLLVIVIVCLVAGLGAAAIILSDGGSVWASPGEALLSGAVLGGIFVGIERALAGVADRRSRRDGLRTQLTMTESLVGIDLRDADLAGLYLPGRDLTAARMAGADLTDAVLLHANLQHASLRDATLARVDLGGSALQHADLSGCSGSRADFVDCDASHVTLTSAVLRGANFMAASLRNSDLRGVDLSEACLHRCDLRGADLRGADLAGCDLSHTTHDDSTRWPEGFEFTPASVDRIDDWPRQLSLGEWLLRRQDLADALAKRDGATHQAQV